MTALAVDSFPVYAGAYQRISLDEENTRLGVMRQREDLERQAERLGWQIVDFYEDNDITGSGKKHRSGYARMTEDLKSGRINAVLATEMARLQRGWEEYAAWFSIVTRRRALVSYGSNVANFSTGDGVLPLEMYAAMAREELSVISRRWRRKHQQMEQTGMPNGGMRAYGYDTGFIAGRQRPTINIRLREPYRLLWCPLWLRHEVDLVIDEAQIIREMAKRVLEGEAIRALVTELNQRGIPTANFKRWSPAALRQILTAARISGRRERFGTTDEGKKAKGVIVGKAQWPAIISVGESDALRRLILDPKRRSSTPGLTESRHPFVGLVYCAEHGVRMFSNGRQGSLRCSVCSNSMLAKFLDPIVDLVKDKVNLGELAATLRQRPDTAGMEEQLVALDMREAELAAMWARAELRPSEWTAARNALEQQRTTLEERIASARSSIGLEGIVNPQDWDQLSHAQQRTILGFFLDRIIVRRSTMRGIFDPERVQVVWKR